MIIIALTNTAKYGASEVFDIRSMTTICDAAEPSGNLIHNVWKFNSNSGKGRPRER